MFKSIILCTMVQLVIYAALGAFVFSVLQQKLANVQQTHELSWPLVPELQRVKIHHRNLHYVPSSPTLRPGMEAIGYLKNLKIGNC